MKKITIIIVMIFTMSFTVTSCKSDKKEIKKEMTSEIYQCPMDCENGKSYTKAGSCPVCKMDLKAKKAGETKKEDHSGEDHSGHNH